MGIQGEGEIAFPVLLDRMQRVADLGGTPGLYLRGVGLQGERQYAEDLDQLPLPDVNLWPTYTPSDDFGIPVQTRRGCPMKCNYCSTATLEGYSIRRRSPDLVVENIARHVDAGYEKFYFVDNTFNLPLSYAKERCRKIIDGKLVNRWSEFFEQGGRDL